MAHTEKTDQIDHYLDQINKKDGSAKKKRVFLIVGIILLLAAGGFAFTQLSNKDQLASTSNDNLNGNIDGNGGVITVGNNNANADLYPEDEEDPLALLDENLDEEQPTDEEQPVDEEAEAAENNNANDANDANNNNINNAPTQPTGGVSDQSFTAAELGGTPNSNFTPKGANTPTKTNTPPSSKPENPGANAKVEKEDVVEEVAKPAPKPVVKEEVPVAAPPKPAPAKPKPAASTGVTKEPSYPGGDSKMRQFFARRISYPNAAIDKGVEGNVNVRVKVDERGKIVDSQVVKGIGAGCDKEVLRAINKMPKWEPAMKDGKPVAKYYMLSVAFKLPE